MLLLLEVLPGRIKLLPSWYPYATVIVVLVPMVVVVLSGGSAQSLHVERVIVLLFSMISVVFAVAILAILVAAMVRRSADLSGIQLLASSIAIWATNAVSFSLLYWQIDRDRPEARLHHTGTKPDWLFPQEGVPNCMRPDWRPTFVDYFYLGFSTATAFSTTDAVPLTSRAMMLRMLESSISLVTLIVVKARAISILGS